MKYLCLIYQDESIRQKLPKAEFEKIHGEYPAFTDDLKKIRPLARKPRASTHPGGDYSQSTRRKDYDHRRPIRGDEEATRRLLPD